MAPRRQLYVKAQNALKSFRLPRLGLPQSSGRLRWITVARQKPPSQPASLPFSRGRKKARKEVDFVQLNAFLCARRVSGPIPQNEKAPANGYKENRFGARLTT